MLNLIYFILVCLFAAPEMPVHAKWAPDTVTAYAYNSEVSQTDNSPWITASGTRCRWGTVGSNYYPMGTKLLIPGLFGKKIFTVEDRMNKRHQGKIIDIWFLLKRDAVNFGKRKVKIFVWRGK